MRIKELLEKVEEASVRPDEPTDLAEKIRFRREKLISVREELKTQFVGLDDIIDEVIQNIENWYVMPELNTRPPVVNLWGMTGVGKTDLVRKLVKAIGFGDKFLEVQMSGGRGGSINDGSIKDRIEMSNISRDEPGVVLLDEIQRWRTVDERGNDTNNSKFQDLWMLLSDGKFSSKVKRGALFSLIYGGNSMYWVPQEFEDGTVGDEDEEDDGELLDEDERRHKKKKKKKVYSRSYNDAVKIKNLLRLEESILEIMKWSNDKKQEVALANINNPNIYDGDDYSKLLIFISGNLDEAYSMSGSVNDTDVEADVLHAFSQKINFLTIKKALQQRFKPEQISRFGNTHVIYPSMSRASYEELIVRKLDEFSSLVKRRHNIAVDFDETVYKFIYRNGVIPSQGVRPVFSTISGYIENAVPRMLLQAIESGVDRINVKHSNDKLIGIIGDNSVSTVAAGKVDAIKKENNINSRSLVSVHEAGHALVYAVGFKVAPTQIVSSTTSAFNEGYVGLHRIRQTKKSVGKLIAACMAGRVAEQMIFGNDNCSTGASADIIYATSLAAQYVRDWGFGDYNTVLRERMKPGAEKTNNTQSDEVDKQIEAFVTEGMEEAKRIINDNMELYRELVGVLLEEEKISQVDFQTILAKYGLDVRVVDPKWTLYHNYSSKLQSFLAAKDE